jgi:hypothetical protein
MQCTSEHQLYSCVKSNESSGKQAYDATIEILCVVVIRHYQLLRGAEKPADGRLIIMVKAAAELCRQ